MDQSAGSCFLHVFSVFVTILSLPLVLFLSSMLALFSAVAGSFFAGQEPRLPGALSSHPQIFSDREERDLTQHLHYKMCQGRLLGPCLGILPISESIIMCRQEDDIKQALVFPFVVCYCCLFICTHWINVVNSTFPHSVRPLMLLLREHISGHVVILSKITPSC